jgi:AraC family transcriptional regulator of adaptative response/methylated-DNA-[protein]-cysteine methyltransferase
MGYLCHKNVMKEQDQINYLRIADAIAYISDHFREQPALDKVAEHVHLSPFHFHRLFTDWAGVSPKKFLQFITVEYAKRLLHDDQLTLFDAADEVGLSGTGRLHDLFITIEGMTPGEYRNGGAQLTIRYSFSASPFGPVLIASTDKGICYLAFADDVTEAMQGLRKRFPRAGLLQEADSLQEEALGVFRHNRVSLPRIKLHLKGSPFQLKVWQSLLTIPMGKLSTYGSIAGKIRQPDASRAVGSAVGSNPVAFLIPCHRVIRSSGAFSGYMWGITRKRAIIGWEAAQTQ